MFDGKNFHGHLLHHEMGINGHCPCHVKEEIYAKRGIERVTSRRGVEIAWLRKIVTVLSIPCYIT